MILTYPIQRPGIIETVSWQGDDHDLSLMLEWRDGTRAGSLNLQTNNKEDSNLGEICAPASLTLDDVNEDAIISSIRMAAFVSGSIAGSGEFLDMFADQEGTRDLQTMIGNVKVTDVRVVTPEHIEIDLKKKNASQTRTIITEHSAVSTYSYAPETQLLVVAGAIRAEFGSSYVHDFPGNLLTQSQRDAIQSYLLNWAPWV